MHIRNKDGIWINSQLFREEALHYQKHKYYCSAPWGSLDWEKYWKEQRNRIINGYEVGGARITGDHYFYLNFCPILRTEDTSIKKSKKTIDFPDFWDGDYNYFWAREIAREGIVDALRLKDTAQPKEELFKRLVLDIRIPKEYLDGGYNLVVGKSRRKGFSYKNASIGVKNYITKPGSLSVYGAYEKKYLYPKGVFTMASNYINYINETTAWVMPSDYLNKADHRRNSHKQYRNGIEIEKGFKSEIMALTFKDNPDAARGKDIVDLFFEEAGAFGTPGLLKDSYLSSEDCVRDGAIKTGMITVFGTGGDTNHGTRDFAEMFFNPDKFSMIAFENIWETDEVLGGSKVGFFHPANWNMPGYYDVQGNSDKEKAKEIVLEDIQKLVNAGASSFDIMRKKQEIALSPSDSFGTVSLSIFPTAELKRQKDIVLSKGWHKTKGQPVTLFRDPETNKVSSTPDLTGKLSPITSYSHVGSSEGCPVIYEYPINNAPRGLYKIGYDPVRQDEGSSLAAIIVYKGIFQGSFTKECIVAEYIGRKEKSEDIHLIAELFAEFYNTQVMYENEVPDVRTYFQKRKLLHLLALQPDAVISKSVSYSRTARVFGCHMTPQLKDAGERYIKDWLLNVIDFDENNKPIMSISKLYSLRLIEELLNYNKKGNFDLISALIMCMFQVQEELLGKEYTQQDKKNKYKIFNLLDSRTSNGIFY